jgi:hypothetical protein
MQRGGGFLPYPLFHRDVDQTAILPSLFISFEAQMLRKASVIWLNERWFMENGIDILNRDVRKVLDASLVDEFGYSVPESHDQPDQFTLKKKLFYADRYGGSGIGLHGGSGRCGTCGSYQVKGIGITPLTSPDMDSQHSNGGVTLEEAIREAIFSEIAMTESPLGGVPIVAIIETGTRTHWNERKALIVRPCFFRASYFERAYLFKPSHDMRPTHLEDVRRVKAVVQLINRSNSERRRAGLNVKTLKRFLQNAVAQIAFTHVARLFFGPFSSSNLTITGQLLDYGAARALRNWMSSRDGITPAAFGSDDLQWIVKSAIEMQFYIRKYIGANDFANLDEVDISEYVQCNYNFYLDHFFCEIFGITNANCGKSERKLVTAIKNYYEDQKRITIDYSTAALEELPWLCEEFFSTDGLKICAEVTGQEQYALRLLREAFLDPELSESFREKACFTARRLLAPREYLFRERLQKAIYSSVVEFGGDGGTASERVSRAKALIEGVLSISCRYIYGLPENFAVLGMTRNSYSVALLCLNLATRTKQLVLRGTNCNSKVGVFGSWLADGDFEVINATPSMQMVIDAPSYIGQEMDICVRDVTIRIPKIDVAF